MSTFGIIGITIFTVWCLIIAGILLRHYRNSDIFIVPTMLLSISTVVYFMFGLPLRIDNIPNEVSEIFLRNDSDCIKEYIINRETLMFSGITTVTLKPGEYKYYRNTRTSYYKILKEISFDSNEKSIEKQYNDIIQHENK